MSQIDLDRMNPEQVLDESDPPALTKAVEALSDWTPRRLALVDDVLTGWTADYVARPNDHEGLIALQSAIRRILSATASRTEGMQVPDKKTAADYARRWECLSEAIAARDLTLAERNPERVRQFAHVAEIEAILSEENREIKQSELSSRLALSPSRLSQVLALMEAHGLIHRRSAGREKLILLPDDASKKNPVTSQSLPGSPKRGSWYLCLKEPLPKSA